MFEVQNQLSLSHTSLLVCVNEHPSDVSSPPLSKCRDTQRTPRLPARTSATVQSLQEPEGPVGQVNERVKRATNAGKRQTN
jgi:hypothetical protein